MKKLTVALLFLPFLAGANVSTAAPREYVAVTSDHAASGSVDYTAPGTGARAVPEAGACATRAASSFSSTAGHATQPFVPAYLSAGAFILPTALLETGTGDTWRTHTRSGRSHSDRLHAGGRTAEARTHIHLLQRGMLEFEHTLARARTNEPATFGNPPPASQT